jgi:hypothetical protein
MIDKQRCSSLDRVFACPGSILPCDAPPEAGGPDAVLGRACHEALSYIPQGVPPPVAEIAAKYGVDADEIERAVANGRRAWRDKVGIYFPTPLVERRLEGCLCRGTSDVVQATIDLSPGPLLSLRIGDWKTGRSGDRHPYQLMGYASAAVEEFGWPANDVVTVFEIWTACQRIEVTNIECEEIEIFRSKLAQMMRAANDAPDKLEYRAGGHCNFCPHRSTCPTLARWMRGSVTALVAVDHGQPVTRETLARNYLKAKEIDKAMRRFWAAVDLALEDGPLELPDGSRAEHVYEQREKIAAGPAVRALVAAGLVDCGEDEDFLRGDVSKARLTEFAAAHAPKGRKAALMREIYAVLRKAEAIREEPRRERRIVDSEG